jgi:hypothetical protein
MVTLRIALLPNEGDCVRKSWIGTVFIEDSRGYQPALKLVAFDAEMPDQCRSLSVGWKPFPALNFAQKRGIHIHCGSGDAKNFSLFLTQMPKPGAK